MTSDPTAETWRYNPNPGQWHLERPPTRYEALLMAAQCASSAADNLLPADAAIARAEAAKAWAAIATAAPTDALLLADFRMPAPLEPTPFPVWNLFGLDAGRTGNHGDGCTWPLEQCIGHAEYNGCPASLHVPQPGTGVRCARCGQPGVVYGGAAQP